MRKVTMRSALEAFAYWNASMDLRGCPARARFHQPLRWHAGDADTRDVAHREGRTSSSVGRHDGTDTQQNLIRCAA